MDTLNACPHCDSTDLRTVPTPTLKHHAKVMCGECGRWLRWLPKPPRAITREIVHALARFALADDAPLPALEGTRAQVDFASKVRALALPRLERQLGKNLYRLVRGITDSGWYIANRDRPPEQIRWPESWFEAASIVGEERA